MKNIEKKYDPSPNISNNNSDAIEPTIPKRFWIFILLESYLKKLLSEKSWLFKEKNMEIPNKK